MRCAAFAPTRGSSESCATLAVLMFTTPVAPGVACVSAANAAAPSEAIRIRDMRMGRDFRMVLFLLSFGCYGLLLFGCFDRLALPTRGPSISILSCHVDACSGFQPPPFARSRVQSGRQVAREWNSLMEGVLAPKRRGGDVKNFCFW